MTRRSDGPVCILTAEDAAILWQAAGLNEARIQLRSESRAYSILVDIYKTALSAAGRNAASGNSRTVKTETREAISEEVVTVTQIAKRARVSPRTIRNHIAAGTLPAIRLGREWIITRREADIYVAGRKKN